MVRTDEILSYEQSGRFEVWKSRNRQMRHRGNAPSLKGFLGPIFFEEPATLLTCALRRGEPKRNAQRPRAPWAKFVSVNQEWIDRCEPTNTAGCRSDSVPFHDLAVNPRSFREDRTWAPRQRIKSGRTFHNLLG